MVDFQVIPRQSKIVYNILQLQIILYRIIVCSLVTIWHIIVKVFYMMAKRQIGPTILTWYFLLCTTNRRVIYSIAFGRGTKVVVAVNLFGSEIVVIIFVIVARINIAF